MQNAITVTSMVDALGLYASTAAIGLVVLWLFAWVARKVQKGGTGKALPVPPSLPLLGHWLTLRSRGGPGGGDRLLLALRRWGEAYGGAFRLRPGWLGWGGPQLVVLSDPAAVHALLALGEDAAVKSRRHYSSLDQVLHRWPAPNSLTASSAAQWQAVRRSLLHAFSATELAQDFEVAKAKALSLASIVLQLGPGVVLDVDDAALRLSLDVAGLSKLGYDFEAVEAQGEVLMLRLLGEVATEWDTRRRRLLPGWLAGWVDDTAAAGDNKIRILQDFLEAELWSDIESRGPPPPDDVTLAAQLVRLWSPPGRNASSSAPPGLSFRRTLSELAAQLLMAHEPVGHAIAWALHCLAACKPAQDKLVAELKREGVFDKPQSALTFQRLPRLPFLDCCVREALRLYPTIPCPATVRTIKKDVSLGGWRVPAGCEVWVDVFAMHRSPRHWRDPDRFNPERWAETAAATAEAEVPAAQEGNQGAQAKAAAAAAPMSPAGSRPYDGLCTVEPDPGAEDDELGAGSSGADTAGDAGAGKEDKEGGRAGGAGGDAGAGAVGADAATAAATAAGAPPLCSPVAFMPFGGGPRSCLGQRLAVAEVKAALAVLLCYLVFQPGGEAGDAPRMAHGGLFLRPAAGVHLQVAARKRGT